jgi:rhodanese-related sulfurtransferase
MTPSEPAKDAKKAPLRRTRRGLLVFGLAGAATAGVFVTRWYNLLGENAAGALSPGQAYAAAGAGEILLIDIRRPDEWARTGLGERAIGIDMRQEDFEDRLLAAVKGDKTRPVALICARGVRSRRLAGRLSAAGFTRVVDVPEGMLGSGAGPGWLKRNLPVVAYE